MWFQDLVRDSGVRAVVIDAVSVGVLVYLFIALIIRARNPKTPIWAYMSFASFVIVFTGLVSVDELGSSIDLEVILFLVGVFAIVAIAEESGLLDLLTWRIMNLSKSVYSSLMIFSLAMGLLASVSVNDTIAVIGPVFSYTISRVLGVDIRILALILMYSITIGSVMTPIGNPQNMLIATESNLTAPFLTFLKYLLPPTIINLVISTYLIIKIRGIRDKRISVQLVPQEFIRDRREAIIGGVSITLVILTLIANDLMKVSGGPHIRYIGFIPFIIASGAFLVVRKPREIIRSIDWGTILFFITMFITMTGVWRSRVLRDLMNLLIPLASDSMVRRLLEIEFSSIVLSQFISNVPFTKIFIEYVRDSNKILSEKEWVALAMSSTIAGNLTLLGAASNIIVLETLESRYRSSVSAIEFMKIGALVTLINIAIYNLFLLFIP
ncbi:MAG: SLC13 family permease [Sulfolobales archaeon]